MLSFCLDESASESASESFFFLGFQHSRAQCLGLPQLWQFPGQRFWQLPSDPVAARASSACPSFLFPPCPCWLRARRFFSRSDSSQMLFMSVSVPTTWLLIRALDRSRVANFASLLGRLLSTVHWYSFCVTWTPAAANSSFLQCKVVRKVRISPPLGHLILKKACSRSFCAYMLCVVNSEVRRSQWPFVVVRD